MKSHIARKLILYIVLFSSVITLVLTALQLYLEFQYDVNGINQKLEQIKVSYKKSITQSAWVSDKKQLQVILDGITKLSDIAYAEVNVSDTKKIKSGSFSDKDGINITMNLNYSYNKQNINIGTFTVVATLKGIYKQLINRLGVILLSNALKTFLVAIFIYFIFVNLVARHLTKIYEFSEKHDALSNNTLLSLDRKPGNNDEFDVVVQSINTMHTRLNTQIIEINQQKQYLAKTLDSIGDAVIATDKDGNITRMNPIAEKLTGWIESAAIKQPLKNIFSIINASTREVIENPIEKVLATGETVYLSNHTTLIAKDGREHQIADSAAPIMSDDEILGMVLVFNDVTEQYKIREALRESEQRFRQLAENLNEVFWLGAADWSEILYVSPAYEKNWGLSREILYKKPGAWLEAVHPDDYQQVLEDIPVNIDKRMDVISFREYRIKKPDGEEIWIKARAYPIRNTDGDVIRIAGIAEDITVRKIAEETIRRSQKMDALGKLTGGIAHDYNNMLGIILGYSEHLIDLLDDQPEIQKYADRIKQVGERGAKLTKKLLSFAKNRPNDFQKLDINKLLKDEKDILERTLTARIQLDLNLCDDLWHVYLTESDLEDAILNICINAMHAIDGSGKIIIETCNQKINANKAEQLGLIAEDYVLLTVADTGCGMTEALKNKIFDPFFSTKGVAGTGLGLSQVYGFIKRCKGAVTVDSNPQQGSRFNLYFPRYTGGEPDKQFIEIDKNIDLKGKGHILVVDDEVDLLSIMKNIISKQGYTVFCAENGKQALDIIEAEEIDLLVSDVVMPEMDGYELAAIVQDKYPQIKIQLASGFDEVDHAEVELVNDILQKPYEAEDLLRRIKYLLSLSV